MKKCYELFMDYLRKSFLGTIIFGFVISIILMFNVNAYSAELTLAWNANKNPDLAGYKVYYGTSKTKYTYSIDVINSTSCNISGLKEGNTYYLAATTFTSNGYESDFSNQVSAYLPVSKTDSSQDEVIYRINTGGPAVSINGLNWDGDKFYSGSSSTYKNAKAINGTTNDALYQSERYGSSFSYKLPVDPGVYMVTLHFAELYFSSSRARVFDIDVEKSQYVLNDFDIVEEVGPATAVVKTIKNIRVTDGNLDINFDALINNGKVSAIEVILISADL